MIDDPIVTANFSQLTKAVTDVPEVPDVVAPEVGADTEREPEAPDVAAAAAEVGTDTPMLVPAIANPFPMVVSVVQDEDDGTGCAAGVAGSP